ncbi:hypothetical protein [Microbacterium halotolerans]|uniref:hypothetical protein n=1 Tax=Microbacterium halotolerans TaxID=246613 RepID=UPI000E6AC749|nr:hypothetical protein [Microbacterium halotolerans]
MSAETEYTVYRRDSRDAMVLDAADPVRSLEVLLEKATAAREDAELERDRLTAWAERAVNAHQTACEREARFRKALAAVREGEQRHVAVAEEEGRTDGC